MTDGNKLALALLAVGGMFAFIYFISRPTVSAQSISSQPIVLVGPVRQARLAGSVSQDRVARQYINEETWDWKDWKGRDRSITVHRKLTQL